MRANTPFPEGTTSPNANHAAVEDAANAGSECPLTARRRLEDRFRQAFAERAQHDESAKQYENLAPALPADRRSQ
jgi:hypothetical protein